MVLNLLESIINPGFPYTIRGRLIQYSVSGSLPSDKRRDLDTHFIGRGSC